MAGDVLQFCSQGGTSLKSFSILLLMLKVSKTPAAFTKIYYDEAGVQRGRTFFCLQDLPKIFDTRKDKERRCFRSERHCRRMRITREDSRSRLPWCRA